MREYMCVCVCVCVYVCVCMCVSNIDNNVMREVKVSAHCHPQVFETLQCQPLDVHHVLHVWNCREIVGAQYQGIRGFYLIMGGGLFCK